MEKFVLYCKSYYGDVYRVKTLFESIQKHNKDNLPFYVSVPMIDTELFKKVLGTEGYILINDESIDEAETSWFGQQIIKSQFHRIGVCENYLCVDSDCFFIKDFYLIDLMYDQETPYTICHEHKDFFVDLRKHGIVGKLGFDPFESFSNDRRIIKQKFLSKYSVIYDFGPGPTIWSCRVWKSLEENLLKPNNLQFKDLLKISPSEFTWYGEYLMFSKEIPLYPRQPFFKAYHYKEQFELDIQLCGSFEELKEQHAKYNFFGIGLQSNWYSL